MKNKGLYRINTCECTNVRGHIWSSVPEELSKLCLTCFQPKFVLR